jgi:hypothetical protein
LNYYIPSSSIYDGGIESGLKVTSGIGCNIKYSHTFPLNEKWVFVPAIGYSYIIEKSEFKGSTGSFHVQGGNDPIFDSSWVLNYSNNKQFFEINTKVGYKINSKFTTNLGVSMEICLGKITNFPYREYRYNFDIEEVYELNSKSDLFLVIRIPFTDVITDKYNPYLSLQAIFGYGIRF